MGSIGRGRGGVAVVVLLVVLCALFLTRHTVNGQACQAYNPSIAHVTGKLCPPFLADQIFVPLGLPTMQTVLDGYANSTFLWMLLDATPILPLKCFEQLLSLTCHAAYPTCVKFADGEIIGQPQCSSLCTEAINICKAAFDLGDFLNCSLLNPLTGREFWPESGYSVGDNFVSCSTEWYAKPNMSSTYVPPQVDSCPYPLTKVNQPTVKDSPCEVGCPDPTYTPEQWNTLITVGTTLSIISEFLIVFMIVTYLIMPSKRRFPARIMLYWFLSGFILVLTFCVFGGPNEGREVWCETDTKYSTQSNWRCALQATTLVFGSMAMSVWWVVQSFNLVWQIVLEREIQQKWEKYYHVAAWGFPSFMVIIALSFQYLSYSPENTFCFIFGSDKIIKSVQYPIYYIPTGVFILVSTVCLGAVFRKIYMHIKDTNKLFNGKARVDNAAKFNANVRISLISTTALFFLVWLLGFRLYVQGISDQAATIYDDWMVCRLKTSWGIPDAGVCGDELPKVGISYAMQMGNTIILSGVGILFFAIFGTDRTLYAAWHNVLSHFFPKFFDGSQGYGFGSVSLQASTVTNTPNQTVCDE